MKGEITEKDEENGNPDDPQMQTGVAESENESPATSVAQSPAKSPGKSPSVKRLFKSPKKTFNTKRMKDSPVQQTVSMATQALSTMKNILETKHGRDEFTVFGEQVSLTLRNLSSRKAKIIAQHKINNILFEAQMGKYDLGDPLLENYYQHSPYPYRPPLSAPQSQNSNLQSPYSDHFSPSPSYYDPYSPRYQYSPSMSQCSPVTLENNNSVSHQQHSSSSKQQIPRSSANHGASLSESTGTGTTFDNMLLQLNIP